MKDNKEIRNEELSEEELNEVAGGLSLGNDLKTQVKRAGRAAGDSNSFNIATPAGRADIKRDVGTKQGLN